MSFMPSYAYVAKALYDVGADKEWEDISPDEQQAHMLMAKVAIVAILTWQAQHRPDGSTRYKHELIEGETEKDHGSYAIYDTDIGRHTTLATVHDALLAEQIVTDLNHRDTEKKTNKGPIYGD